MKALSLLRFYGLLALALGPARPTPFAGCTLWVDPAAVGVTAFLTARIRAGRS